MNDHYDRYAETEMGMTFDFTNVTLKSGVIVVPYCDLAERGDTLVVTNIDKHSADQVAHSARRYARNHNKLFTCALGVDTLTITRLI
jgi:hypothetical protein